MNDNVKSLEDAAREADGALNAQALREHAEVLSRRQSALPTERPSALSPDAARDLLHELRVHQIELEMQNEELRRGQLELDASRARYFDLYDLAPVGYCSLSERGLILQANLAAATLLGTGRDGLVGQSISHFIFKEDQDTWYRHQRMLMQTTQAQAQALELRMVRKDRSAVWVEVAVTTSHDAGPPVIRVVLFDVSDRKTMAAAMRDSEGRYRALVEWSPEAMLVHLGGKIVFANPAAAKILGARTANALEGKALLDRVHPDFHAALLAGLTTMADQGGGTPMAELRCLKLDGTSVDVEAQSIATLYDGKQVTVTSLHDIGARKPVAAPPSS